MTRNELHAHADRLGIPPRTLQQVKAGLAKCRTEADRKSLTTLMINHGRITDDARKYLMETER